MNSRRCPFLLKGAAGARLAKDASRITLSVGDARLSLVFVAQGFRSDMLFISAIVRIAVPQPTESNDLLVQSRIGHAGLTVIALIYVLVTLWQR